MTEAISHDYLGHSPFRGSREKRHDLRTHVTLQSRYLRFSAGKLRFNASCTNRQRGRLRLEIGSFHGRVQRRNATVDGRWRDVPIDLLEHSGTLQAHPRHLEELGRSPFF